MKDSLGVACSGLCICHCALTPALLATGGAGVLGGFLASEFVHNALLLPVVILALSSFPSSFRRHRSWRPGYLALLGAAVLLLGPKVSEAWEAAAVTVGGSLLILAHLLNRRYLSRLQAPAVSCGCSEAPSTQRSAGLADQGTATASRLASQTCPAERC